MLSTTACVAAGRIYYGQCLMPLRPRSLSIGGLKSRAVNAYSLLAGGLAAQPWWEIRLLSEPLSEPLSELL